VRRGRRHRAAGRGLRAGGRREALNVSTPPANIDVAVVGAGVQGLATALFLARGGRDVAVLERGDLWREASGVNAGSLAIQNKRLPLVPYSRESVRMWAAFQRELGDVGFVPSGGVRVAESDADVVRLRASADDQRALGVPIEWLEGAALRQRVPWIGRGVIAATFCAEDSFAIPLVAGGTLAEAVRKAGGTLWPRTPVMGIAADGDRLRLATPRAALRCRTLVIAAGVWSGQVARLLGVTLPVGLDTNMLTITEAAGFVMDRMVSHVRGVLTLKQYPNGTCMIGGGWQGVGDVATSRKDLDYEALLHNFRVAAAVVPGLAALNLVRSWAGLEGSTPDLLPLVGRLPGHDNVFITACARGGFTLGPVLGRLLAELIVLGETSMPIATFAPGRFAR
jgi:glycine/D-amino acid oxidase-like deaminating enzyme